MKGDQILIATMNCEFWSLLVLQLLAELRVINGFLPAFMQVDWSLTANMIANTTNIIPWTVLQRSQAWG